MLPLSVITFLRSVNSIYQKSALFSESALHHLMSSHCKPSLYIIYCCSNCANLHGHLSILLNLLSIHAEPDREGVDGDGDGPSLLMAVIVRSRQSAITKDSNTSPKVLFRGQSRSVALLAPICVELPMHGHPSNC